MSFINSISGLRRQPEKQQRAHTKKRRYRNLQIESLDPRIVLAASLGWDGPGLGTASLSYYVAEAPASLGLEQEVVESAIESALGVWSQVADVTFTATAQPRQADSLDIRFAAIDGAGGVLAQAYLPDDVNRGPLAGDITFDALEPWEIGNASGGSAFDFVYVAVHEIGHALGLGHLDAPDSVLRSSLSPNAFFSSLSTADEDAILQLYAPAKDANGEQTNPDNGPGQEDGDDEENDQYQNDGGQNDGEPSHEEGDDTVRRSRRGRFGRFRGRAGSRVGATQIAAALHNEFAPLDVNGDGRISVLDAMLVIERLGLRESSRLNEILVMADVNQDDNVNVLDAYAVVDRLAHPHETTVEGNAEAEQSIEENTQSDSLDDEPMDEAGETDSGEEPDVENEDDSGDESEETETAENDTEENDESEDDEVEDDEFEDDEFEDDEFEEDESEDDAEGENEDGEEETEVDEGALMETCHVRNPFARFDINDDQLLTEDETPEEFWQRISAADTDADGAVSIDELTAFRDQTRLIRRFERLDANQDGAITEDEVREEVWARISEADLNTDGAITSEELGTLARHRHRAPFARFDANQDGQLTIDETPDRLWTRISTADINNDGAVTADELDNARAQRPFTRRGGRAFRRFS